jgi:glycosyltransferase involved in cell wall biosynthesis
MKILLVNWQDVRNPAAGGAEIHLFALFSRLAARGHEVRLVCGGFPGGASEERVEGIQVLRVGGRWSFALRAWSAIRRAIAEDPPDVVVEDVNKLPLFTPWLTHRPLCVLVPHLFGDTAFQGASWPIAAAVWLAERPIPRVYRRAAFHVISESTRDDLIGRGIPASRIVVIHPGVDAGEYFPDPALDRSPAPSFLFVGRLKRYKGADLAIRALALARETRKDLTLHVAGTGEELDALHMLARSLGVGDAVSFPGAITEAEKIQLFRTVWGHLLPSAKEGWGMTVIEAAACGTPSIASDSPGLRDSVRHGVTGVLVPHGDVEALAREMLGLATDRSRVDRWGEAARVHAESLSWDAAADQTEAHLAGLVAPRGSPSHPREL